MDLRADFVEDKAKFRRLAVASQEILTHEVFFKDLLFLNSTRSLISLSETGDIHSAQNRIEKFCFFQVSLNPLFPRKTTEEQSCFRQDLCPQTALYSHLWA